MGELLLCPTLMPQPAGGGPQVTLFFFWHASATAASLPRRAGPKVVERRLLQHHVLYVVVITLHPCPDFSPCALALALVFVDLLSEPRKEHIHTDRRAGLSP